jgi:hypothetical protein
LDLSGLDKRGYSGALLSKAPFLFVKRNLADGRPEQDVALQPPIKGLWNTHLPQDCLVEKNGYNQLMCYNKKGTLK